jgi:hypothetical protein
MKEKLRQVRGAICENRRDIARTRLEAIAGADNPYSLISIFGWGHLVIKAGGAIYVTKCSPVEVVPRIHSNYTKEQLNEFARIQDSQGTRKAYLVETAELAYTGRTENAGWTQRWKESASESAR